MSRPYCTSLPREGQYDYPHEESGKIVWGNGGWACDSGPVEHYLTNAYLDDGSYTFVGELPQFRYWETLPNLAGLDTWAFDIPAQHRGKWATLDLYAFTHSVYPRVYDWWEAGNNLAGSATATARIHFQIPAAATPPQPHPNPSAAAACIEAGLGELSASAWAKANPGEWSKLVVYRDAPGRRPTLETAVGKSWVLSLDGYHFAKGDHV